MQIEIINPLEYSGWDELLLLDGEYSFFHSTHWARVLCDTYHYQPFYFTIKEKTKISLLIPIMQVESFLTGVRGVSLPFSDWCEPVIAENVDIDDVWSFLREYGKKAGWAYLEIRGGDGFGHKQQGFRWFYDHTLDLSLGEKEIYSRFRESTRRNINKSRREGIEVRRGESIDAMKEFYYLNCLTRREHGLPPQPYSFFKKIYEIIIEPKHGMLMVARYKGKAIAASIYFHFGKKAVYKYGASDSKYQHLRPNNLVMWYAIQQYCQTGITDFGFGRTDEGHDGLRRFKASWGAEEKVRNYYRYDQKLDQFVQSVPKTTSFYNKIFTIMPMKISRVIGEVLYRHVG